MAEKTKQHFVPKLYLKNFAQGKIFNIYNHKNDKMINNHDITNYLIDINFISSYELELEDYNKLFNDYSEQIGERELKKCVSYILSKSKKSNIENKLNYIRRSIKDYIPRLQIEDYGQDF